MDRAPGLSVRLKLTLSYAGFLMIAGALLLAAMWLFILRYLGEHIADFKVPQYVAVSAAPLPRNPGGKLLKRKLREETDWAAAARR